MRTALLLLLMLALPAAGARLVSVGTSVTETICGLGACGDLVGVDTSSKTYIQQAAHLPDVGAFRSVSSEGIVSLKPSRVFLAFDAGTPEAIQQLRGAGVDVVIVPRNYSLAEVKGAVRFLAGSLGVSARGEELVRQMEGDMAAVAKLQAKITVRPKVLFCGLGPNSPTGTASGTNTRIDELIWLSGGVNAMQSFEGSRPLTEEGVIAAAPDTVLMTERGFERAGGVAGVRKLPGVALTPAGKAGRVVAVSDMYFQGFGPGIGKAVLELTKRLHPELR